MKVEDAMICQYMTDYQIGYEQGKADQKKEDNEFFNFDNVVKIEKSKSYQQGVREFAEWLPKHFDLRFSSNPDVWLDEFFNHTSEKVLAEWQKGEDNAKDN